MSFDWKHFPLYLVCLYGIISHALLFIAFIKDPIKCFRKSTTYFVANLAVFHVTVCLSGPFTLAAVHWSFYIFWHVATFGSILTILSVAADRYLMVAFPFKHRSLMNRKKTIVWIIFIWILSAGSGIELFLHPKRKTYVIDHINIYIAILIMLLSGLFYTLTYLSVQKQGKTLAQHNQKNRTQEIRQMKEKRFLNTILLAASIEFIGILPCLILYKILHANEVFFQRPLPMDILWRSLITLNYYTYAINPLIYFLRLPNYRKTFLVLYCKKREH